MLLLLSLWGKTPVRVHHLCPGRGRGVAHRVLSIRRWPVLLDGVVVHLLANLLYTTVLVESEDIIGSESRDD